MFSIEVQRLSLKDIVCLSCFARCVLGGLIESLLRPKIATYIVCRMALRPTDRPTVKMAPDGFNMASKRSQDRLRMAPRSQPRQSVLGTKTSQCNSVRCLEKSGRDAQPKNNISKTRKRQSNLLGGRRSLLRPSRRLTCVDTQGPFKSTSRYVGSPIVGVRGSTERRLFPGCAKESGPVTGHRTLSATLCH